MFPQTPGARFVAGAILHQVPLHGHLLAPFSVAFSPDGSRLATASRGKEAVKLWDVATGQELAMLEGEGWFCERVMFSPDGRAIAAGAQGEKVNLWRALTWPEIEAAERLSRASDLRK